MSYVKVLLPTGVVTFPHAVADVFELDVLTVTWGSGVEARVYPPDTWEDVTVYGEDDYPLYWHRNSNLETVRARVAEDLKTIATFLMYDCAPQPAAETVPA